MEVAVEDAEIGAVATEVEQAVEEDSNILLATDGGSQVWDSVATPAAEDLGGDQVAPMDAARPSQEAVDEGARQGTPDNGADAQVNEELPGFMGLTSASSVAEAASQIGEELPGSLSAASASAMQEVEVPSAIASLPSPVVVAEASAMQEVEAPAAIASLPSPVVAPEASAMQQVEAPSAESSLPSPVVAAEASAMQQVEAPSAEASLPSPVLATEASAMQEFQAQAAEASLPSPVLAPEASAMQEFQAQAAEASLPSPVVAAEASAIHEVEAHSDEAPLLSPLVALEAPGNHLLADVQDAPMLAVVTPGNGVGDLSQCEPHPALDLVPESVARPECSLGATQNYTEDDLLCGNILVGSSEDHISDVQGMPADVQATQMYQDFPIMSNLECEAPEQLRTLASAEFITCPAAHDSLSSTQCYLGDLGGSTQQDVMATQHYVDIGHSAPVQPSHGRSDRLMEAAESATQCYLDFGAEFIESQIPSSPGGVILTSTLEEPSGNVTASCSSTASPQVASTMVVAPRADAAQGHALAAAPLGSQGATHTGEETQCQEPMTQSYPLTQNCYPLTQTYQSFQFSGPVRDVPDDGSSDEGGSDEGHQCQKVLHRTPQQPLKTAPAVALGAAPKWRAQPGPTRLFTDMPPPPLPQQKPTKRALADAAEPGPVTPIRGHPPAFSDVARHSAEKRRRCSPVRATSDESSWTPGRRLFGKQPVPASARRAVRQNVMVLAGKQDLKSSPTPLRDGLEDAEDGDEDAVMWLGEADGSKFMTLIRGVC